MSDMNQQPTPDAQPLQGADAQQAPMQQGQVPQAPQDPTGAAPTPQQAPQQPVNQQPVNQQQAPQQGQQVPQQGQQVPQQGQQAPQQGGTIGQDPNAQVIGQGGGQNNSGQIKDPSNWATGDQPMTESQRAYLETLATQAGETLPGDLTKAQASEHIDRLQAQTGRGQQA